MLDLILLLSLILLIRKLPSSQRLALGLMGLIALGIGRWGGVHWIQSKYTLVDSFGWVGFGSHLPVTLTLVSISFSLLALFSLLWINTWKAWSFALKELPDSDFGSYIEYEHLQRDFPLASLHLLLSASLPIVFLLWALCFNVHIYGDLTLEGANQMALLLSAALVFGLGKRFGLKSAFIFEGVKHALNETFEALFILLLIGALSGTWMLSGVVPALIDYGLALLSPSFFLPACCVICACISVASGSSWSTIATIGLALMGIGKALQISPEICAGAIISGAYFGDKLSPLSDTTNLAPAMSGGQLFKHIRAMLWTTIPSVSIALILFTLIGFQGHSNFDAKAIEVIQNELRTQVWIHPILLCVPLSVAFCIYKRMSALSTLTVGILAGGLMGIWTQPQLIGRVVDGLSASDLSQYSPSFQTQWTVLMNAMSSKFQIPSSHPIVADLLKSKGMSGMLNTVWLILCAITFGGALERSGFLQIMSQRILAQIRGDRGLIVATTSSCLFLNITASDQYLALIVPGRMYRTAFEQRGFEPEALSRTLEDSATVTSVLIPWNTCGATQASILGVATWSYAPYCFFNWISPCMTLLFAFMGWKQFKKQAH